MKRTDYINWDEYFMGIALLTAMRSKDPSSQVGACIVSPENKILSLGYNGIRRESSPSGDGDKSPLKILTSAPVRVIIHKDNMVCGWFRARNYGAREVFYYGTY